MTRPPPSSPALDQPSTIRDGVEVEHPHAGEVRVRMVASGVCHSDRSFQNGTLPITLPAVIGHEGAGVVEEVGEGVTDVAPGDHVVISWVPQCRECFFCTHGQPHLCRTGDAVLLTAGLLDGNPRLRLDGAPLQQALGTGTFCETTVVDATAVVKVPDDLDLSVAALLGCAVLTGVGAALNTATITPGDTVVGRRLRRGGAQRDPGRPSGRGGRDRGHRHPPGQVGDGPDDGGDHHRRRLDARTPSARSSTSPASGAPTSPSRPSAPAPPSSRRSPSPAAAARPSSSASPAWT